MRDQNPPGTVTILSERRPVSGVTTTGAEGPPGFPTTPGEYWLQVFAPHVVLENSGEAVSQPGSGVEEPLQLQTILFEPIESSRD